MSHDARNAFNETEIRGDFGVFGSKVRHLLVFGSKVRPLLVFACESVIFYLV